MAEANQNQEAAKATPGEIQERFKAVWEKTRSGMATPEEQEWLLKVQEEYWAGPDSLGNLYH
jgi:hypothetical protein